MKLYFLVEGQSSETTVYPEWIKHLLPYLPHCDTYDELCDTTDGFYLISGYGYPSIYNHIESSAKDVSQAVHIDYFFIIIDADEDTVSDRELEVSDQLSQYSFGNTEVVTIIQNRCFETMLLGNKQVTPRQINRQVNGEALIELVDYYNVHQSDPELMGSGNNPRSTHSQFHYKYLATALRDKRIPYTKRNAKHVSNSSYMDQVISRVNTDGHLSSFKKLFDILHSLQR